MTVSFESVLGDFSDETVQRALEVLGDQITPLAGLLYVGTGAPGGVITASPPAIYLNRSGGAATTLYVKESGVNTTGGWVAK
jgi:hypothetical protein